MNHRLAQNAIVAALAHNWQEAADINRSLLDEDPADIDALNRLSKALFELGKPQEAIKLLKQALAIDPLNAIAQKNIERYSSHPPKQTPNSHNTGNGTSSPAHVFLEEPGKTRLVPLIHLAEVGTYLSLDPGDSVELISGGHRVSVNTMDGRHVGKLPDDVASRLNYCIKNGNEFVAVVKSVSPGEIKIFIRETKRSERFANTPSFPLERKDAPSQTE